jgi:hypothetical protein
MKMKESSTSASSGARNEIIKRAQQGDTTPHFVGELADSQLRISKLSLACGKHFKHLEKETDFSFSVLFVYYAMCFGYLFIILFGWLVV